MKIRRTLATAVAVAVTAPGVLLCATPAFADAKPAAQTQQKPSITELEKIAGEARKAYEDAVAAESAASTAKDEAFSDTAPLTVASAVARKAADDAQTAKDAADQAVADAKAVVEALPDTATEEEEIAAAADLTSAEAAAVAADAAKTAADAKAEEAEDADTDARLLATQNLSRAKLELGEALAARTAADEALAKAKEEEETEGGECVPEPGLTAAATGLPSTVVAGTTAAFSLRVTNGTDKAMDEVMTYASVHATDTSGLEDIDKLVSLQWSTNASPKWQQVETEEYIDVIGPLKAGAHADIKMRLSVDASAPAGNGFTFVAGDYFNEDGSCGGSPDLEMYEFEIKAAGSKPGRTVDAEPVKTDRDTSGNRAQGGASKLPVDRTTGALADTGASSGMSQIALAGGAAMAIGAGAVFVVRRRKTGSNA